jgi:hypothetical protein
MAFDPARYGLNARVMPLVQHGDGDEADRQLIEAAVVPEAARAGLYLYAGCWEQAHEVAQSIPDADGSYWHGIVHRQEPDAGNASYWFAQVGRHPIFPALAERAAAIEPALAGPWDPVRFIRYCESARQQPGGEVEQRALAIQNIEWELLFHHSSRSATRA